MTTHHMSHLPEYEVWCMIVQRCTKPKSGLYKNYGARGITICKRWLKFENFIDDMGRRPNDEFTIERKNNSRGYTKSNCLWATFAEQNRNRRGNRILIWRGKRWIIADLAHAYDMAPCTLHKRLADGWSLKRALETKPRSVGRRRWVEKQPEGYIASTKRLKRTRRI